MRNKLAAWMWIALLMGAAQPGVAALSGGAASVEIVTSEPMEVYVNGRPVAMHSGEFGFAETVPGSNRLTLVHATDEVSAYRLSTGAVWLATPANGENRVEFDFSAAAGGTVYVEVEGSPTLAEGTAPFGFYHLARDSEHTVPLTGDLVEFLGVGCREITIRSAPYQDSYRSGFRRWYVTLVELEASLCGTPSTSGPVEMDLRACSGTFSRLHYQPCWWRQEFDTIPGTLTLALGFDEDNRVASRDENDLSPLPRTRALLRIYLGN